MTTAAQLVNTAMGYVGTIEVPPGSNNTIFGASYGWNGVAWCDIFQCEMARKASGGYTLVGGKFAYTVAHANRFVALGRWGTTPRLGALIFFDWSGSRSIPNIDHVGLVRGPVTSTGLIPTIEGNTRANGEQKYDGVYKVLRSRRFVVGFGYPAFSTSTAPASTQPWLAVDGSFGRTTVMALQVFLNRVIRAGLSVDGGFGTNTKKALQRWLVVTADGVVGAGTIRALQRKVGVTVDGSWGPNTTKHLQTYLNLHRA